MNPSVFIGLRDSPAPDEITGTAGADSLTGTAGADRIIGGAGADTIAAGGGDDTIIGGAGDDLLSDGAGDDVFVFAPGHGDDTISDMGVLDTDFDRADLTAFGARAPTYARLLAAMRQDGADVLIDLTAFGGGTILSRGASIEDAIPELFIGLASDNNPPASPPPVVNPTPVANPDETRRGESGNDTLNPERR